MKKLALIIICLSLFILGCATSRRPLHTTSINLGTPNAWKIEGTDWKECWLELRYLMGRTGASGVYIIHSDDNHMLVNLKFIEGPDTKYTEVSK